MDDSSRPASVIVVIVVAVLLGIGLIVGGISFITLATRYSPPTFGFIGVILLGIGVVDFVAGWGIFNRDSWSWPLGLIGSFSTLIVTLLQINVYSETPQVSITLLVSPYAVVGLIFPIVMIYSFTKAEVRTYFD